MKSRSKLQQGRILLIVLIVAAAGVAFNIYRVESNKSARIKEEQRIASLEADRVRVELAEKDRLARQELAATEERLAADKKTDALRSALRAVDDLYAKWQDAEKVAGATSRIGLAAPVATLQALRRDAEAVTVPPCLDTGKTALIFAMDYIVDGYIAFMQNTAKLGDFSASIEFEKAKPKFEAFKAERAACPVGTKS